MVNCPHPYDLQSHVDGALRGEERASMDAHLATCADCRARVRELERLRSLLASAPVEAPPGLLERLLDLLRSVVPVRKLGCSEALEMASAYLDDELNQTERETLEAHLFACEDCYHEYVAMREAAQAMRATPRVAASVDLKARILAAVEAEKAEAAPVASLRPAFGWRRALVPTLAMAAVALLGYIALNLEGTRPGRTATTLAAAPPSVSAPAEPAAQGAADVVPEAEPTLAAPAPGATQPGLSTVATPEAPAAPGPEVSPAAPTVRESAYGVTVRVPGNASRRQPAAPRPQPAPNTRTASHSLPAEAVVSPSPGTQTHTPVSTSVPRPRQGSRLTTGTRTTPPATRLAITPDSGWGTVPTSFGDTASGAGLVTTRRLPTTPPPTIRPAVVVRRAATADPERRKPVAEAVASAADGAADGGGTRVAQKSWVPRVAEDRTTLFVGREPGADDLKARSERVNARARTERLFPDDDSTRLN